MFPVYFDGRHSVTYYATREILAENFNPMVTGNARQWEIIKRDNIQVQIDYLGERTWINVPRKWLNPSKWAQIRPY